MKLNGLSILAMIVAMCALVASVSAPSTPFMIRGYVFYEDGSACDGPVINTKNLNTSNDLDAETNANTNYYQFTLANGTDVNVSEVLRFEVKSPDGSPSNITVHTVTQDEINDGGIFNFNITLAPMAIIFDTGHGTYPSIMGIHEGNFTPNCNITVHQIYTYPCVGTGGHSERVIFYDYEYETEVINKSWGGYQGDYHNITVSPSVELQVGKRYRYEIITGSYPQIIHNETCGNGFGKMTCSKFVDANGKEYNDWIPAIRLG
ncbi:MAG: hypothetical protein KAU16_05695 [Methanophagales archaeon]|nr:hypothetical protein [Methanophagales archaeon]